MNLIDELINSVSDDYKPFCLPYLTKPEEPVPFSYWLETNNLEKLATTNSYTDDDGNSNSIKAYSLYFIDKGSKIIIPRGRFLPTSDYFSGTVVSNEPKSTNSDDFRLVTVNVDIYNIDIVIQTYNSGAICYDANEVYKLGKLNLGEYSSETTVMVFDYR